MGLFLRFEDHGLPSRKNPRCSGHKVALFCRSGGRGVEGTRHRIRELMSLFDLSRFRIEAVAKIALSHAP
jgi:hypothetical protein